MKSIGQIFTWFVVLVVWIFLFWYAINFIRCVIPSQRIADVKPIELPATCNKMNSSKVSGSKVVIRLDDVQADAYKDITENIINDTLAMKMRLVLGVIPKNIQYDSNLVKYLTQNLCNIEIAVHGWDHSTEYGERPVAEFEDISEVGATERFALGIDTISKTFHIAPITFIPPGNRLSKAGHVAIGKTTFRIVSAADNNKYDMSVSTYDFEIKKLIPVGNIMKECTASIKKKKLCVIVVHPQDYLTDSKIDDSKYTTYIDLLKKIASENWQVVTFNELLN